MNDFALLIFKCLLIGVIWATFLLPVIFQRGSAIKYILCALVVSGLCFFFRGYSAMINQMTILLLVSLVLSWITSMAFFAGESKVKSKVIAFSSLIAPLAYLVTTLFVHISIF